MPVIMKENVQYGYTDEGVKAHTLSYAEYQALSTEEKMNGDLYFIPDKQPEGNPSLIWNKLGTSTLDTDADNVSDAINEHEEDISQLNSSLSNKQDKLENGKDILLGGVSSTNVSTSAYTNITIQSIASYSLIHFNTSYYTAGKPNYGGVTLSVAQIRKYTTEAFTVSRFDNSYRFSIKYVNDTTLAVMVTGTTGVNNCLSIHAIL